MIDAQADDGQMSRTNIFSRHVKVLGGVCLVAGLAGCSPYYTQVGGGFSGAALTAHGALPIQIDGKVGSAEGAPLAQAVAAAMPASVDGVKLEYAPCKPDTECPGDHLVWTFGPPEARPASVHPAALSYNVNLIGSYQPEPNNVAVKVMLIQGGHIVASASGQVDADNPDDPNFKSLIGDLSGQVLEGPDWLDWVDVL
jgi:hypothetical protein